jgi:tyrosine-protein kinase Etk/Wzc
MKLDTMSEAALRTEMVDVSAPAQELNLLDVLIILSRRRRFIGWFTLSVTVLTAIIVLLIPNKYTATSVILPPSQNTSMSSALMGQMAGSSILASLAGSSLGIKNPADMYVALFRSTTVEDTLIQRFDLMARYHKKNMVDARHAFENRTTVVLGVKDGLIRVSVTDRDPRFAAQLANAYVDEFRKHSDSLTLTEASQRRAFFQAQLLKANEDLAKAEQAMKKMEQTTGVLQLDSQAKALIEQAAVLRAQIAAKEVQLQSIRSFETEDNPQYAMVEQQLDALQAQLAKVAGPDANTYGDIGLPKTNIPETGMAYIDALRDFRYDETITELLTKQFEAAKLDEARQGTIQISDVALPPDKKSSPYRGLIVILMTFIAVVIAVLWVLSVDRWQRSCLDPEKAAKVEILRQVIVSHRK